MSRDKKKRLLHVCGFAHACFKVHALAGTKGAVPHKLVENLPYTAWSHYIMCLQSEHCARLELVDADLILLSLHPPQPPTLAPMGTGYVFSPLPQPSSPVEQKVAVQEISADVEQDSAYSSDDHTPVTNESEQGGGDTFQGVDLDRLFERRHSKKRREACFIPSPGHGLLPTPAIVGITSLPQ